MAGHLTTEQREVLRPFIEGKEVYDLGAGAYMPLCRKLLDTGARRVVAVDKHFSAKPIKGVKARCCIFLQLAEDLVEDGEEIDVAFISWPMNSSYDAGLVEVCERAKVVVYLGTNTGGSACGTPQLFKHLLGRRLLAAVPHRLNTMLICGERLEQPRDPTPEEAAGIEMYEVASAPIRGFDPEAWAPFLT